MFSSLSPSYILSPSQSSYLSSSFSSLLDMKFYIQLQVDPKPAFIIDKIMHLYDITSYVVSYIPCEVENGITKSNTGTYFTLHQDIAINISYHFTNSIESRHMMFKYTNNIVYTRERIEKYLYLDNNHSISSLRNVFDKSRQNPYLIKEFIDNTFEIASRRGIAIYMQKSNDPSDIVCVWPAFYTHDQMQIDLDLKSPLAV